MGDKRSKPKNSQSGSTSTSFSMPLTERQQLAYLLSMTAKENKADESNDDILESRKLKKAKLSPVSSINRPRNKNGETQLHICTMKGEIETIKSMVKQGADVNCRDNANWTPLHEACNHGHYKIAKFLLKSGAIPNAAGLDGDTPLHDASSNGHLKIVLLLLRHGADPHHKNDHGESPIDVAEGEEVIEALQNFTKEMLKDLKPKKDYSSSERHRYKDDGEGSKKKSHKKTISNIDDFLETGSPSQSSKDLNRDGKRLYEKGHSGKSTSESSTGGEKGGSKHKKDSERYMDSSSTKSATDSSRYLDGIKKQKMPSLSKPAKIKESFSSEHKLEKSAVKKFSESDSKHDAFKAERKRHHSESSALVEAANKKKSESKHTDKRMDDSDDDLTLSAFAGKDFKNESQDYSHAKKIRKHSLSLDSDVKEKYYVRDEREFDKKLADYAKAKDTQIKKSEHKVKDETTQDKLNELTKVKQNTAVQSSSFMKAMKDSIGTVDRKLEKCVSKKPADPRMKTSLPECSRTMHSSSESVPKKLSQSFSASDYKHEKSVDKQLMHRERKLSGESDEHKDQRYVQVKKVKGGVLNEYKSVVSTSYSKYEGEHHSKEKREKSPFLKNLNSEGSGKSNVHDSKEASYSHSKKMETKITSEVKLDSDVKTLSKKYEYLQKAKKISDALNKTYLGDITRTKIDAHESDDQVTPEFHDASLIKKTYSKFDKSVVREQEKKLNSINQDLSKAIMRDNDKRVNIISNQDVPKVKHKNKHKNKSESDNDDVPLKLHKEVVKIKKEKQINKDKVKKEHYLYENIDEKAADTGKTKCNLSKYKHFLDDSDEENKKKYFHHDDDNKKALYKNDERRDSLSRSANDVLKDKFVTTKKETSEVYSRQNSYPSDDSSTPNKDYSEKLKTASQVSQKHISKVETDNVDVSLKKKSTNKEKMKMYSSDYLSYSMDESSFTKKTDIDHLSRKESERKTAHDYMTSEMAELKSSKSTSSISKEFGDKKSVTGDVKPDHALLKVTKSVDILLNDNRAALEREKEKRRKEKQKQKLKKLLSLQESSDYAQKYSDIIKEKEKKYDAEKGQKHSSNKEFTKVDKNVQEVPSLPKQKTKDISSDHKFLLKLKHGKFEDEEGTNAQAREHTYHHGSVPEPKCKSKESGHESKSHLKLKEARLSIDSDTEPSLNSKKAGLGMVSPSKFKARDDKQSTVTSVKHVVSEGNQDKKGLEGREKQNIVKLADIEKQNINKLVDPDNSDFKNSQKSKELKSLNVHSTKPKTKENVDSNVILVKQICARSNQDGVSKTSIVKQGYDVAVEDHCKGVATVKEQESCSKNTSREIIKKTESVIIPKDEESEENEDLDYYQESINQPFKNRSSCDEEQKFEDMELKEERHTYDEEYFLTVSSGETMNTLRMSPNHIIDNEFEKSHMDILDTYLDTTESGKYQSNKDPSPDSSSMEIDLKSEESADVYTNLLVGSVSTSERKSSECTVERKCSESTTERKSSDSTVERKANDSTMERKASESKVNVKQEMSSSQSEKLLQSEKCTKESAIGEESGMLPDLFDQDDKIIEEHILACGPKVDKSSKHKAHNAGKREGDTSSDILWKKHKRKHSDDNNANVYHSCLKTKKTRSLDCDVSDGKNSHVMTGLKDPKSLLTLSGDASPKKRQKHSKSSDGIEYRYKVSSAESSASTEVSPVKHPSDYDCITTKLLKHTSSKEEKIKSLSGTKNAESTKPTDTSSHNLSPIKSEFKVCVQSINMKDGDIIHRASKLKEVDLNMNLGLNDTALELVKKKKRKRHSESKESVSDLRVLKVPTESISVENVPSPEDTQMSGGKSLVKEGKLPLYSSNQNLSSKLTELLSIKTLPEACTKITVTETLQTSSTDIKLPIMSGGSSVLDISNKVLESRHDTELTDISTNKVKLLQDSEYKITIPELSMKDDSIYKTDVQCTTSKEKDLLTSCDMPISELILSQQALDKSTNESYESQIDSDLLYVSSLIEKDQMAANRDLLYTTSLSEKDQSDISTDKSDMSTDKTNFTTVSSNTVAVASPVSSNRQMLESSFCEEKLSSPPSETLCRETKISETVASLFGNSSSYEGETTENSSSEMELSGVTSEEDVTQLTCKDMQSPLNVGPMISSDLQNTSTSTNLETKVSNKMEVELMSHETLTMLGSTSYDEQLAIAGSYSSQKICDAVFDEGKLHMLSESNEKICDAVLDEGKLHMLSSSNEVESTLLVSMDTHNVEPFFNKGTKEGYSASTTNENETCEKDIFHILTSRDNNLQGSKVTDVQTETYTLQVLDKSKYREQSEATDILEDTGSKFISKVSEHVSNEEYLEQEQKEEQKVLFDSNKTDVSRNTVEELQPKYVLPSSTNDSRLLLQELPLSSSVGPTYDTQNVDGLASFDMYEPNYTSEEQFDDDKRDEENENAVVNLLNMDREIDEDNNISSSSLLFIPTSYIQKDVNKVTDCYVEDNNDGFQDDSSQGSACSTLIDFDNKTEEENLSNIFDHLNDITKSIADNQFTESTTHEHAHNEFSEPDTHEHLHNQFSEPVAQEHPHNQFSESTTHDNLVEEFDKRFCTTSSLQDAITNNPDISSSTEGTSISNILPVVSYENLLQKAINDGPSAPNNNYCSENVENIKDGSATVVSEPHFETPTNIDKPTSTSIPFEFVPKASEKEILNEDLATLAATPDISLKNDEFSELMLPSTLTTVSSFGQRFNDLDSIDTSDLIKPEKVSCGTDILSNPSDSIILKKDLIDGQLGFSTNLSSDEIISKFADCILELDDTDNTYSLREYIPPPPAIVPVMNCPQEREKEFASTISSVVSSINNVSSINMLNQCNSNISGNDSHRSLLTNNQFYTSTDSMYVPPEPVCEHSTAITVTDSNSITSVSQPLYVNTVNTVTTRLSTSDQNLYSPKNIFAHGKMYSPKPTVLASCSSSRESRRVNIEPCDIFRSIIESNIPIVPEPNTAPLPTIPEDLQEKEKEEEEVKKENDVMDTTTDVKTETNIVVSQEAKPVLPPRLRNWREAISRRCSRISHAVNARDLDLSLQKIIREPTYKEVIEKASAYNLPQDMMMTHASEKEKLRMHMVEEWCRAEQSVDLSSKEKGPISAMSILYYQRDHISRKLGSTLDFKSKAAIKPDYHKLRNAKLTELQDKFQQMQQEMEKRHHLEIEAHQKFEQLDTIFDQKKMLRKRYLRFRNKISV